MIASLIARGISPAVLERAHVSEQEIWCPARKVRRLAALVPIGDAAGETLGRKALFLDGEDPKARWIGARAAHAPECAYGVETLRAGASALLCEGEKDQWLLATLDLPSMSLLCGASTPPRGYGLTQIREAHPSRVLVYYDRDAAGQAGAGRAVHALRAVGLSSAAYVLPESVGEHGDITDLYHGVGRDRDRFIRALAACVSLPVQERAPLRAATGERHVAEEREGFNRKNPLLDLLAHYGVELRRTGRQWAALCPFHQERTPSFKVMPSEERWRCHGACQTSGDAWWFDYLWRRKGTPWTRAS